MAFSFEIIIVYSKRKSKFILNKYANSIIITILKFIYLIPISFDKNIVFPSSLYFFCSLGNKQTFTLYIIVYPLSNKLLAIWKHENTLTIFMIMFKMPFVLNPCSLYLREIMIIELTFNLFRGFI